MTPRPGQARTGRGRREASAEVATIGPIEIMVTAPRSPVPVALSFPNPREYTPADGLARDLATVWRAIYNGGSWSVAAKARQAFVMLAETFQEQRYSRWNQVAIETLTDLEDQLAKDDGLVNLMWRGLRSVPKDSRFGYFSTEVARFLSSNRSLRGAQTNPTEPLPAATLKQVLRAAISDVSISEARVARSAWDGASAPPIPTLLLAHEVMAYFVLLAFEWNMSIDVIAGLRFDDHSPTRILDWGDTGRPSVRVQWFKRRGRASGQITMLADQPLRAGSILRRLRDATAANRYVARTHGWEAMPWLCAYESTTVTRDGRPTGMRSVRAMGAALPGSDTWTITPVFTRKESSLRAWCQRPRKPGLEIDLPERYIRDEHRDPLSYRTIRPAAKWAKFVATGKGLLLGELVDDNTIEVLSAHYLNSDVAMRDIGEAWADITTLAEEIARGKRPIAINRAGEIVSGPGTAQLDQDRIESVVNGELKAGMTSCLDILHSPQPGERAGHACKSAWRACFFCENGVVTPDDIPAMKLFLLQAEDAHGRIPPAAWALHWGRTVRWIMHVMPLMDPDWLDLPIAPRGLFDLGLEVGPA